MVFLNITLDERISGGPWLGPVEEGREQREFRRMPTGAADLSLT